MRGGRAAAVAAGACWTESSPPARRRPARRPSTTPTSEPVPVTIRPSAGVDALYAPRRTVLDRVLVDAARGRCRRAPRAPVTDLLARPRRPGRAASRSPSRRGGTRDVRAGSWSAPTGRARRSPARSGAHRARGTGTRTAVALPVLLTRPARRRATSGPTGRRRRRRPDPDQRRAQTCVFVGDLAASGCARCGRAAAEDAFDALLADSAAPRPRGCRPATPAGRLHGWGGRRGFVRRSWGPGWALVGDAGYFKDPISTHGITDALRDAELLADAARRVPRAGAEPEAVGAGRYQRERDALSHRLFEVTRRDRRLTTGTAHQCAAAAARGERGHDRRGRARSRRCPRPVPDVGAAVHRTADIGRVADFATTIQRGSRHRMDVTITLLGGFSVASTAPPSPSGPGAAAGRRPW